MFLKIITQFALSSSVGIRVSRSGGWRIVGPLQHQSAEGGLLLLQYSPGIIGWIVTCWTSYLHIYLHITTPNISTRNRYICTNNTDAKH